MRREKEPPQRGARLSSRPAQGAVLRRQGRSGGGRTVVLVSGGALLGHLKRFGWGASFLLGARSDAFSRAWVASTFQRRWSLQRSTGRGQWVSCWPVGFDFWSALDSKKVLYSCEMPLILRGDEWPQASHRPGATFRLWHEDHDRRP